MGFSGTIFPAQAGDTDPPLKAGFGVLGLGYLSSFANRRESGGGCEA
jgi:hypothetical protein